MSKATVLGKSAKAANLPKELFNEPFQQRWSEAAQRRHGFAPAAAPPPP